MPGCFQVEPMMFMLMRDLNTLLHSSGEVILKGTGADGGFYNN